MQPVFSNFIPDDGYTEPGYIAAVPGIHEEFRFIRRPMLVEEQDQLLDQQKSRSPREYDQIIATVMAQRLVSWSLVDPKGRAVPINAVNVLRLKSKLFNRLFGIILGTEATDVDPRWNSETKTEQVQQILASALSAQSPGVVQEVANAKN